MDTALDLYLRPENGAGSYRSAFWALLGDARVTTGRDWKTGEVVTPGHEATLLSAAGFLCFIDQVGTALRPTNIEERRGPPFVRALHYFGPELDPPPSTGPDDTEDVYWAFYALRCCLVHSFGLCNVPKDRMPEDRKARLRHRFQLTVDKLPGPTPDTHAFALLPTTRWNGEDWHDMNAARTVISLCTIADLATEIANNVILHYLNGTIAIALDGGEDELRARFVFGQNFN